MAAESFEPIHLGPITVTFFVDAEMSNGTLTLMRCDVEGGEGLPVPHSHDAFEETIYGLEGVTTFAVDGKEIPVGPGGTLCIRRGEVHSFMAEDGDASFLAIPSPGVFGPEYFFEIRNVIAASDGPPDPQAFAEVMLRHGLTPVPQ